MIANKVSGKQATKGSHFFFQQEDAHRAGISQFEDFSAGFAKHLNWLRWKITKDPDSANGLAHSIT